MKIAVIALLGAGLAFAAPAFAATNLLQNGGFESAANGPASGANSSYFNIGVDNALPGDFAWSVDSGNVDIISYQSYGPAPANGGSYGLDLVGYGGAGKVSQSINTVLGKSYKVSFDYEANRFSITNPTADVSFNGTVLGSVTGGLTWQTFTGSFIGTGAPAEFSLNETFGGNNGGVFLDNISVSAVPETATWISMILGFGLLGLVLRTRKNSGIYTA